LRIKSFAKGSDIWLKEMSQMSSRWKTDSPHDIPGTKWDRHESRYETDPDKRISRDNTAILDITIGPD
jgi:hypothetical protein